MLSLDYNPWATLVPTILVLNGISFNLLWGGWSYLHWKMKLRLRVSAKQREVTKLAGRLTGLKPELQWPHCHAAEEAKSPPVGQKTAGNSSRVVRFGLFKEVVSWCTKPGPPPLSWGQPEGFPGMKWDFVTAGGIFSCTLHEGRAGSLGRWGRRGATVCPLLGPLRVLCMLLTGSLGSIRNCKCRARALTVHPVFISCPVCWALGGWGSSKVTEPSCWRQEELCFSQGLSRTPLCRCYLSQGAAWNQLVCATIPGTKPLLNTHC